MPSIGLRRKGRSELFHILPVPDLPRGILSEYGTYELLCVDKDGGLPGDVDVLLNDQPCERIIRAGETSFRFENSFVAGEVELTIVKGDRLLFASSLTVDPDAAKLIREEYAALLEEISAMTLALYREGGATADANTSFSGQRSDPVSMDLVRSNIRSFDRAILRIAENPSRTLRSNVTCMDVLRAGDLDDRAIERALIQGHVRPATAAESLACPAAVNALRGHWLPQVDQRSKQEDLGLYENRALLGFILWLDATLAGISGRLVEAQSRSGLMSVAQTDRIARWRGQLALLKRKPLFVALHPVYRLRSTPIFRMQPDYASAFSAMSRMRVGLGNSFLKAASAPLARTHSLYEMWCLVRTLRWAADRFPDCRRDVVRMLAGIEAVGEAGVVLLKGHTNAVRLTHRLSLTYQRPFAPGHEPKDGRTHMVEVEPDIVLEHRDDTGYLRDLILLDPKYRSGQSLMDGIRDLHVYRDAIVGLEDRKLIRSAVVLAPRASAHLVKDFSLERSAPYVVLARPGHDPDSINRLLDAAVESLAPGTLSVLNAA